jgi:hypothetical protein
MLAGLKGKRVALYLPQNQNGLEDFLVDSGFKKEFSLSRMFFRYAQDSKQHTHCRIIGTRIRQVYAR